MRILIANSPSSPKAFLLFNIIYIFNIYYIKRKAKKRTFIYKRVLEKLTFISKRLRRKEVIIKGSLPLDPSLFPTEKPTNSAFYLVASLPNLKSSLKFVDSS